jgi:hypothetical protein
MNWPAGTSERFKTIAFFALCLLAVTSTVYEGYIGNRHWFVDRHVEQTARVFAVQDVDDAAFLHDIRSHPTATGPLFWWHNGWHGNRYPYYWRPLTMLSFWIEYHLFGAYRFDRWQIADIFFHLVFTALLAYFAFRVTRSRFAAPLSAIVFTGLTLFQVPEVTFFIVGFTTPDAHVVLFNWKDQPEEWGGICTLISLLFAMRGRWLPAIGCAFASVCFKESGWLTYPMLLLTAIMWGRLRDVPKSAWVSAIVSCIVLIALRASAGHHVMFPPHDANNRFGLERYLNHVVDPNLRQLSGETWPIVFYGIVLAFLILTKKLRPVPKLLTGLTAGAATSALIALSHRTDIATAFACLVDWESGMHQLVEMTIYALIVIVAFRYRPVRRQVVYLYGLVLISDLLEMFVRQPNAHMLYLTNGFQSILVVAIGLACLREIRTSPPATPSMSASEAAAASV